MKYEATYNPAAKVWVVWRVATYGAEAVKRFKTQQAAEKWIAKQ